MRASHRRRALGGGLGQQRAEFGADGGLAVCLGILRHLVAAGAFVDGGEALLEGNLGAVGIPSTDASGAEYTVEPLDDEGGAHSGGLGAAAGAAAQRHRWGGGLDSTNLILS